MSAKPGLVYLVTGGCGFLGQHILRMLLGKDDSVAEIRLFDLTVDDSLANLSTEKVTVKLIQGDITDLLTVLKVTEGVDVVIHSASLVDVWHKVPESKIRAVNIQGTCHVIQACQEHGIQYLIYTSSMEVVGPNVNGEPFYRGNEDTEYNIFHNMPYPKSKAQAERLVIEANGKKVKGGKTLYTCALRPTGIYGEKHELMRQFYNMGMRTGGWMLRAIPVNIEHGRVYAGNVAWMHVLAARMIREKPDVVGGQVYFCYDDSPYKSYEDFNMEFLSRFGFREVRIPYFVLTVMAMVNDFLRTLLKPLFNYTPLMNRYTLTVASTTFTVKTDKAERDFGYRPLYSWQQCLDNTITWISTFAEGVDAQKEK
ncbi:3 beta-hydroxysteroid dehydrogenase type 7 [Polyodon spathula]|nr:3 beta-hydroxysteroid dehydrogenase type 7 [Polyodon spathula]XP_041092634.1 3 beta-hydroxysteroid dehydrogenase type 7 [Polyodon spathula]XP_041092635.1 3 beta-hydroxysteroid dehydrogenase type 7 [Polyodon spathula]XP_041092636.1 3 beta-hydroxysteroid dehydrogenase type 7 [Polyodon spathula]XP_041092637.1 3 beta-hydroxysteroid dehydrogenase type 7 [Polyodon spathula]